MALAAMPCAAASMPEAARVPATWVAWSMMEELVSAVVTRVPNSW